VAKNLITTDSARWYSNPPQQGFQTAIPKMQLNTIPRVINLVNRFECTSKTVRCRFYLSPIEPLQSKFIVSEQGNLTTINITFKANIIQ